MAGPFRNLAEGNIECELCGEPIPDREFCSILVHAYNNNGNPQPRRPRSEKLLCPGCGVMALENPTTVEADREQLTLSELEQLLNKYIQKVMRDGEFACGHKRDGIRGFRNWIKEYYKEESENILDESTAEGGKLGVSARKPILTAEELYEGRQRLGTEEQKELFDKQISRAESPLGEYTCLESGELRKLRRILEKAFPEKEVAPYDIRCSMKIQEIRDDVDESTDGDDRE